MQLTCPILALVVAAVVVGVESADDEDAPYSWSALSFLSSQNSNKRSADDSKVSSLKGVSSILFSYQRKAVY